MSAINKDSKTYANLMAAFAGESQANRKYTAFANKATEEGDHETARIFQATAESETGHAIGHLQHMGLIGNTRENLQAAIDGETHEYTHMYPEFAEAARAEGYEEVAKWFEMLAGIEHQHADRYKESLAKHGASSIV